MATAERVASRPRSGPVPLRSPDVHECHWPLVVVCQGERNERLAVAECLQHLCDLTDGWIIQRVVLALGDS